MTGTVVGRFPSDWDERPVDDLAVLRLGGNYRNDSNVTSAPLIKMGNIGRSRIDVSTLEYIPKDEEPLEEHRLFFGDVLLNTRNTLDLVGKVAIWKAELPRAYYNSNILRFEFQREHCGSSVYFGYALNAEGAINKIRGLATGTTSVAAIYSRDLRQLRLPVPPLPEQKRIAEVLSDADELIVTLERLIKKKESTKQGMMQQLLTGQTRLPGFTEPWREARLRDVLTVRHGRDQKQVEVGNSCFPILATGGQIGWARVPIYSKASVLIGRKGTIDRPQFRDSPFWTVDTLFYTEIRDDADPRYLYYVFQTVDWRSMSEASGVPSLSSTRVESVELRLPDKDEQIAIRATLDDADVVIDTLRQRLTKARAIKQGMMQELLTGRTRLPITEAVA